MSDEVARLDVAQDFLLARFEELGLFRQITFKGGTALRKLYAGSAGRFSTDIDVAVRDTSDDRAEMGALIAEAANGTVGPFTFSAVRSRGGRWQIAVESEFGAINLQIKLDVGTPCWLSPDAQEFVSIPIHRQYGFVLPALPCMRIEEIVAEKIARLARRSTARDAFDLVWLASNSPHSGFDREMVRRLVVLKVWVDNNGLRPGWEPAIGPKPFDADVWLARRGEWDDEQIGMLTSPPPSLASLEAQLATKYAWLASLSADEATWARADARDRASVIRAIQDLPGGVLTEGSLY